MRQRICGQHLTGYVPTDALMIESGEVIKLLNLVNPIK